MMDPMTQQKALNLLGLATRARKLISGEDQVLQAIQKQKATLVIVTKDISPKSKDKLMNKCAYYEIPFAQEFLSDELSLAIGKNRSILALTDAGFTKSLLQMKGFNDMNE